MFTARLGLLSLALLLVSTLAAVPADQQRLRREPDMLPTLYRNLRPLGPSIMSPKTPTTTESRSLDWCDCGKLTGCRCADPIFDTRNQDPPLSEEGLDDQGYRQHV